jgi:hypothetical protein
MNWTANAKRKLRIKSQGSDVCANAKKNLSNLVKRPGPKSVRNKAYRADCTEKLVDREPTSDAVLVPNRCWQVDVDGNTTKGEQAQTENWASSSDISILKTLRVNTRSKDYDVSPSNKSSFIPVPIATNAVTTAEKYDSSVSAILAERSASEPLYATNSSNATRGQNLTFFNNGEMVSKYGNSIHMDERPSEPQEPMPNYSKILADLFDGSLYTND